MPTITIPGAPPRALTFRNVTDDEAIDAMRAYFKTSFQKRATDSWERKNLETENVVLSGVTCRIVRTTDDADYEKKKSILALALRQMEGHFAIPNDRLEVYTHTGQASIGYTVYRPGRFEPSMIIVLGSSAITPPSQILASKVKAYYKPTFTVNEDEKASLCAVFHEFGHAFHQLQSPGHFHALAAFWTLVHGLAGGGVTWDELQNEARHQERYAWLSGSPSKKTMVDFQERFVSVARTVSTYASSHPNEHVPEVFSGLMMGAPISDDAMTLYRELGGPPVPNGAAHVRTGQNVLKKYVLYPIANAIRDIGDH